MSIFQELKAPYITVSDRQLASAAKAILRIPIETSRNSNLVYI